MAPALRIAFIFMAWCGFTSVAHANPFLSESLVPTPEFTPQEVVEIQLEALRNNDAADNGIAVVYRFASPTNRAQTGPLLRFANMIKRGPYALMLNYESLEFDEAEIVGNQARVRVVLVNQYQKLGYFFILTRQTEAPYKDCWMTDIVGVVQIGGTLALAPASTSQSFYAKL